MRRLIDRNDQIVFGEDIHVAQPSFDAIVSPFSCSSSKRFLFVLRRQQQCHSRDSWIVAFALFRQTSVEEWIEEISAFAIFFGELLVVDISETNDNLIRDRWCSIFLLEIKVDDIIVQVLTFVQAVQIIVWEIESDGFVIQRDCFWESENKSS